MTAESIYELQLVDCNCNECKYLVRNNARLNTVRACDDDNQYWFFRRKKARAILRARAKREKDLKKSEIAVAAAVSLEYNYSPLKTPINYGGCVKLNKDISFIPNIFQLETQNCFEHRKLINQPPKH